MSGMQKSIEFSSATPCSISTGGDAPVVPGAGITVGGGVSIDTWGDGINGAESVGTGTICDELVGCFVVGAGGGAPVGPGFGAIGVGPFVVVSTFLAGGGSTGGAPVFVGGIGAAEPTFGSVGNPLGDCF
jgi:hypothetical protein